MFLSFPKDQWARSKPKPTSDSRNGYSAAESLADFRGVEDYNIKESLESLGFTPLKENMEHVLMEIWKIMFLSKWVMAVGSSR